MSKLSAFVSHFSLVYKTFQAWLDIFLLAFGTFHTEFFDSWILYYRLMMLFVDLTLSRVIRCEACSLGNILNTRHV